MVKKILLVSGMVLTSVCLKAETHVARSFFMPRPLALDKVIENALFRHDASLSSNTVQENEKDNKKSYFQSQSSFVFNESTNGKDLARYFLIGGKTELVVDQQGTGDIGSEWLGLSAGGTLENFKSTFTISPQRSVSGVVLNNQYDMSRFIDGMWLGLLVPVVKVRHNLHFHESSKAGQSVDATSFPSIGAALNSPYWKYGKWSLKGISKTGVDDILAKVGYTFYTSKKARFNAYASLLIPAGDRSTGEFVFEPTLGTGGHVGFGPGISAQLELLQGQDHSLSLMLDAQYRYFFESVERRSVDINNKMWSRYLLFNVNVPNGLYAQRLYGSNFLTPELSVCPRGTTDVLTALHYRVSWFNVEMGYRFWARQAEHVTLHHPWSYTGDQAISITSNSDNQYFPNAVISNAFPELSPVPATFTPVSESDITLSTARHEAAQSHTVYGATSATVTFLSTPITLGCGGSFEFAKTNAALDIWSVWAQVSAGF